MASHRNSNGHKSEGRSTSIARFVAYAGRLGFVAIALWTAAIISLLSYGSAISAILWAIAGFMAWSPSFRKLQAQGKNVLEPGARVPICALLAIVGLVLHPAWPTAPPPTPHQYQPTSETVAAKLTPYVILPMTREAIPEMYEKLGKAQFDRANELMQWAASAAAESEQCDKTASMGVTERSSSTELRWFVNCANGERFIISEAQARIARVKFDPATSPAKRKAALALPIADPVTSRWDTDTTADALVTCEQAVQQTLVSKGSFEAIGRWNVWEDEETGQATIERDFEATNGFGATISNRYSCVVDGGTRSITALSVHGPAGWQQVM